MAQYDVAIVGSGIVGATMAVLLGESGLQVALIDAGRQEAQWSSDTRDSRVSAITEASRALFTSLGVWSSITARRVSPYTHMQVWDSEGAGEIDFSASEVGRSCLGHIVENSAIVDSLLERLHTMESVTLFPQEKIVGCHSVPESIVESKRSLLFHSGNEVEASVVVGADGSRSTLRRLMGIGVDEYKTGQTAIVASVEHVKPHEKTARQVFLPTGPLAFLPLAIEGQAQQWSSIVWSADDDEAQRLLALDSDDFAHVLEMAMEGRLGQMCHVSQTFSFPLTQRHAQKYVLPGVALIGDAAHSIHPLAGQGANLGLMDAAVLAEELVRAHKRGAPLGDERVLARYVRRRKSDNGLMLTLMDAFRIGFGAKNPLIRVVRNAGLSMTNRLLPVKRAMIRQALGNHSDLPVRIKSHMTVE
ncbi:2-octaprenylphenol hydroxylase [Halomonadaceae bacterium LMG 33818]|uniref:UbiH/UbiF/VisC/COQ6 family ubiquinone biosynthesis hydroxylase n=1 Tax=Cernens ardua TaxID=3402176 RepID=UPI003EDBF9B9